ncbi:hypothetical protein BDR26DRAFT_952306 [Obelidium mucronatum]|nr:hypothetical protein BDR26DRAFT_952306 [Obelidium mucronatum]
MAKDLFLSISQNQPAVAPQAAIAPTPSAAPFATAPVMAPSKFPFIVGKGGIPTRKPKSTIGGHPGPLNWPAERVLVLVDLVGHSRGTSYKVHRPEGSGSLSSTRKEKSFTSNAEVLKTIGGCEIPDKEAEAALDVLRELTGSDEGDVFNCAQVIEEVMFARSEAERLAAKRGQDDDKEPKAGIPIEKLQRIQPAQSCAPV